MGSGRFALFITPAELQDRLGRVQAKEQLHLVLYYFPNPGEGRRALITVVPPTGALPEAGPPDQLFLSTAPQAADEMQEQDLGAVAYAQGWIYLWPVPRNGEALCLCTVSFRSPRTEAKLLFQRVKRVFLAQLVRGVVITSAQATKADAEEGHVAGDIYYSAGAREYAEQGILWVQYGVATQRFWPRIKA